MTKRVLTSYHLCYTPVSLNDTGKMRTKCTKSEQGEWSVGAEKRNAGIGILEHINQQCRKVYEKYILHMGTGKKT